MSYEKEKCKALKEIRNTIARQNNLDFKAAKCDVEEECEGTCPQCEAELKELERLLKEKEINGEKINIDSLIKDDSLFEKFKDLDRPDDIKKDVPRILMGKIIPPKNLTGKMPAKNNKPQEGD